MRSGRGYRLFPCAKRRVGVSLTILDYALVELRYFTCRWKVIVNLFSFHSLWHHRRLSCSFYLNRFDILESRCYNIIDIVSIILSLMPETWHGRGSIDQSVCPSCHILFPINHREIFQRCLFLFILEILLFLSYVKLLAWRHVRSLPYLANNWAIGVIIICFTLPANRVLIQLILLI